MSETTNILQIQRESLGDFDPVKFSDYKLTEFSAAIAYMHNLATGEPGRKFRMVQKIVTVIAEVTK